jgi:hypothetical protein
VAPLRQRKQNFDYILENSKTAVSLGGHPLLMASKAGFRFLSCRASLWENRFALFPTQSSL